MEVGECLSGFILEYGVLERLIMVDMAIMTFKLFWSVALLIKESKIRISEFNLKVLEKKMRSKTHKTNQTVSSSQQLYLLIFMLLIA